MTPLAVLTVLHQQPAHLLLERPPPNELLLHFLVLGCFRLKRGINALKALDRRLQNRRQMADATRFALYRMFSLGRIHSSSSRSRVSPRVRGEAPSADEKNVSKDDA
jgi:hypothetical protein